MYLDLLHESGCRPLGGISAWFVGLGLLLELQRCGAGASSTG